MIKKESYFNITYTKMTGHVSIRLASERVNHCVASANELPRFYTPGEVITGMQDFMRFVS